MCNIKNRGPKIAAINKGYKPMLHLNVRIVLVCLATLLLVIACADTSKKPAETSTQTTETPEQAAKAPSQTAETSIEEVTLAVTGMT